MTLAIFSVIGACLLWSLVFVVPSFMEGCSALLISFGRFFLYGLICFSLFRRWCSKKAFFFSILSTVGCYTPMLLSMQYGSPKLSAFIFAITPITISLFGRSSLSWKQSIPSLCLMTLGIVLAKYEPINSFLGIFFGVLSLSSWTLFAVLNSRFLQKNPKLSPTEWSLEIGTATFFITLILGCFLFPYFQVESSLFYRFAIGSGILGIFSTLLPFFLWNYGSQKIPTSLTGQLLVLEIIFALILIYCLEQQLPSLRECLGVFFICLGLKIALNKTHEIKLQE